MTCCIGVSQVEGWEASDDMLRPKMRGRGASCRVQDSAQKGAAREGCVDDTFEGALGGRIEAFEDKGVLRALRAMRVRMQGRVEGDALEGVLGVFKGTLRALRAR